MNSVHFSTGKDNRRTEKQGSGTIPKHDRSI